VIEVFPDDGYYLNKVIVEGIDKNQFNTSIKNAITYSDLYALEPIEANNFVRYNNPGVSSPIATAAIGGNADYDHKMCYIGDNIYVICMPYNAQAFKYENDNIILGSSISFSGFGEYITDPVADPYGLGCFYLGGNGDYGYFSANYLSVNKDTLEITPTILTLGESRVYGGGSAHFIDENHIFFLTYDYYQGVLTLDRINKTLSMKTKYTSSDYGGNSVHVADNVYLTYYTAGSAESWILRLIKINADYSFTLGSEYYIHDDSGIHSSNVIIKTNNNNIYIPIGNGLLYKVNCNTTDLSMSWTITSTQILNYSWYNQNYVIITDTEDIFFISSS
jgi:hypothetical protein